MTLKNYAVPAINRRRRRGNDDACRPDFSLSTAVPFNAISRACDHRANKRNDYSYFDSDA